MAGNLTISVVIPAYNEESVLADCLAALHDQTDSPDEIIVVDNNSSDATGDLAKRYGAKVINEKKQGIAHARNAGFNAARSDLIARVDADTVAPPGWISRLKQNFTTPDVIAVTGPAYYYQVPKMLKKPLQHGLTLAYFKDNKRKLGHEVLFGSNMAMRRSTWQQVGKDVCTNDHEVHEDLDLAIHAAKVGRIVFDPKLIVAISPRPLYNPRGLVKRVRKNNHNIRTHRQARPE
jgi:glycosyltransferase involved in cell wall biosynthesis